MKQFKDENGKDWLIRIDVSAIKRVRSIVGVDLMQIVDPKSALAEELDDPVKLADVLFVLCSKQAEEASVSDEDFGKLLAGDVLANAQRAMLEELADFFPEGPRRMLILRGLKAVERIKGRTMKLIEEATSDAAIDRHLDEQLKTPGAPSGTPPESSESTQAP